MHGNGARLYQIKNDDDNDGDDDDNYNKDDYSCRVTFSFSSEISWSDQVS